MKNRLSAAFAVFVILGSTLSLSRAQDIPLPNMGDASGSVISPEQERRIGESLMRQFRQSLKIVSDPEIREYIQSLGYRLAGNTDGQLSDFTFFVVEDDAINAFAAPGGFIGVNTGLILATESENELASVLAHEIAHVTQHHLARAVAKAEKLNLPTTAALLAAILLGQANKQLGEAALAVTTAGSAQMTLDFTRTHEQEADRIGIQTLANAGFDPRGMPAFFERLQQATRYYGGQTLEFLSTHPVNVSRIADSRNRAAQYPYRQYSENFDYHLIRAKLRLLREKDPARSVQRFASALESGQYRNEAAERYGYALALLDAGDRKAARAEIQQLTAKNPEVAAYLIALGRIEMADNHPNRAIEIYQDALKLYPYNTPLTLYLAEALLQAGDPASAVTLLRNHLRRLGPQQAELFKKLAQMEGEAGLQIEAHQSLAEYYYLSGDTDGAIRQLKLALQRKNLDFYTASRIEAKLKQLEDERATNMDHGSLQLRMSGG